MKRFSLFRQIALIFILSFTVTNAIIALQVTSTIRKGYQEQLFDRLDSEAKAVRLVTEGEPYSPAENMAYVRYMGDGSYTTSENIHDYIDEEEVSLLTGVAAGQEGSAGRYFNTIGGETIYYVIHRYQGFFGVQRTDSIIVLTDSTLINQMMRPSPQLLVSIFISFALGFLLFYLWERYLLKSISTIRDDLIRMGRDHYKTKIISNRRDELGDLVENIEEMRRQIVLREQSRQELLQGISHDLKTPVGIIQSYAEALEDGMCDPGTAAKVTLKQANRLSDKVNKLLNLTRLGYIDTGHLQIEKVPMDELILELVTGYGYRKDIEFELNLKAVTFDGDAESWRIAIENILDNALRYAKSKIVLTLEEDSLSIYNDGKQIDEAYLGRIFRPYEKSRDGQFGLGLAIVHKTVELYDYGIRVENAADGVLFTIYR